MIVALTHPIKQQIDSQHDFLSSMLDRFPGLLDEWIQRQKEEVEQLANEIAEGDPDAYWSTYANEISRVDPCYDEEQLFNQAMLIMVYSYYESTLLRLAKEINVDEARPSVIANHFGVVLDGGLLKISNYLFNTILPLRNQLCHNNQGTLFTRSKKEEIENIDKLEERKFITMGDDRIVSIDRNFIKKILDGEHKLLLKLAEICGFKTQWHTFRDGKHVIYDSYDEVERET